MQATRVTLLSGVALAGALVLTPNLSAVTWSGRAATTADQQPATRALGTTSGSVDPAMNLPASPAYDDVCWGGGSVVAQQSPQCRDAALTAINNAHAAEGVRPIRLPGNYWSLPVDRQLFVIANLERTARGLRPIQGLTRQLDRWAAAGARLNADPSAAGWRLSSGAQIRAWASNWAADYNSLTADYSWMYLDGWGGSPATTSNLDCTSPTAAGCWGHRDNILAPFSRSRSVVGGTGHVTRGWDGYFNSYSELFLHYSGRRPAIVYTWQDAIRAGAR